MTKTKNFGGRPKTEADESERVHLGLRVPATTKRRLELAAQKEGRSISQETELRIDHTFRTQRLLNQVLELHYGPRLAGILRLIGEEMSEVGPDHGYETTKSYAGAKDWIEVPEAFAAAIDGVVDILKAVAPAGVINIGDNARTAAKAKAEMFSKQIQMEMTGRITSEGRQRDIDEIAEMVGPKIIDRLKRGAMKTNG